MTHCRDKFNEIEVDRLRVKPIVKITGEFWAQTTEGDGNFNMFNFLQKEGAQVLVEPIGTWIMYMIHQVIQKYKDFKGLEEGAVLPPIWKIGTRAKIEVGYRQKVAKLKLAEAIFKSEYHKIVNALGGIAHHLADQYELQRLGHPFYNSRAGGGEGHLEVAKNIYYSNKDLAHMVLSLKPFGCMPSTQSDGAQSAVVSNYKDMIYLPDRDLGRRRDQRAQPRADGARRGEEQGQEGIRRSSGEDRPDARPVPRLGGSASRIEAAAVPSAAHQGRGRTRPRTSCTTLPTQTERQGAVPTNMDKHFLIGMDVGSTTVKAVVIDAATDQILWQDYQRHDTKQPEKVLEF